MQDDTSSEILTIRNLTKNYLHNGIEIPVIRDLSFSLKAREILCLFGRSGSGKTTLLNLIGGLDMPDSGTIIINYKDISEIPENMLPSFRRRNIGFVFQYFNLIPYLTALENVELPMKYEGIHSCERKERAEKILEELGLKSRLDFKMTSLSGGQIQRVAFARAAVMRPAMILADEPTGQLDSHTAEELAGLILSMNKKHGVSFILATHDHILKNIAHQVLFLENARLHDKTDIAG